MAIIGADSSGQQILVVVELTFSSPQVWKYTPTVSASDAPISGGLLSLGYDSFYWFSARRLRSFSTVHSTGPVADGSWSEADFGSSVFLHAVSSQTKLYALGTEGASSVMVMEIDAASLAATSTSAFDLGLQASGRQGMIGLDASEAVAPFCVADATKFILGSYLVATKSIASA